MVEVLKAYILQNWILILILGAFAIILFTTIFFNKKATFRVLLLVLSVFVLSITVFIEFYLQPITENVLARKILMAVRYSATPFIVALVTYALVKQLKAFIFIPAGALLIIDVVSIFTGIVFDINADNELVRGPLGFLPYIVSGVYMAFLIFLLVKNSNKKAMDIVPIVFLSLALTSGLVFPFVFGFDFSKIFCSIIAVALFIYYVFTILQLTKKDPLTGLLNRQAYYAEINHNYKDITAIVSMDMNGLKEINDTFGHTIGDEALVALGSCFLKACKSNQFAYRIGGDEFVIVCRKASLEDVESLVERINKYVSETKYTCSVGYSYKDNLDITAKELLKKSDEAMYLEKEVYYQKKHQK